MDPAVAAGLPHLYRGAGGQVSVDVPAPRTGRPAAGDERAARLRRSNVRLAVALGVFAAALYVGFVLTGIV